MDWHARATQRSPERHAAFARRERPKPQTAATADLPRLEQPPKASHAIAAAMKELGDAADTPALIRRGLVDRGQIVALKIFNEGERQQGLIVDLPHHCRNLRPPQTLDRAPAAFAGNELELSVPWAHDDRLQQARCFDRRRQLGERVFIYVAARLIWIRQHVPDGKLPK